MGGGLKDPLMKGLNPAPHSHSPPTSPPLPCPVELIRQRGGSISQFTQAACSFWMLRLLLRLSCPRLCLRTQACAHTCTHTHASLFFVSWFVCMCTLCRPWNNIGYCKGERRSSPRLAAPAKRALLRRHGNAAHPSSCWLYRLSLTSFQSLYCVNKTWWSGILPPFLFIHSEWRFLLWLLDKIPQLKNTGLIHPSLYLNCNYSKMPNCFGFACMRACVSVCADISDIILVFLNCPDKLMRERLSQDRSNQSSLQVINNLTNRMNEWMRLHLPPSCDGNCKMCFLFIIANIFEAILS